MMRRLAKRLLWSAFVVWAVATLAFFINNVVPGDAARMVAGPQARAADLARVRADLGLDQPLYTQYGVFMRRLVHAGPWTFEPAKTQEHTNCAALVPGLHVDFGRSSHMGRPVVTVLAERWPRTLLLALAAIFVQLAIGVSTGVLAAKRKNTWLDHATVGATLLGISAPTFVIGIALQFVFAYELRLLPLDGFGSTVRDHALGLVLPALTLGVFGAAYYTRLVRDEMIESLGQDYVRTARAKGLGERGIVRHAFRNVMLPLVTVIGLDLGVLMGGAVVTETIFRWPGLGQLSVNALVNRDGPMIVGAVILTSAAIVFSNVVVDLCYAFLDPRVRR